MVQMHFGLSASTGTFTKWHYYSSLLCFDCQSVNPIVDWPQANQTYLGESAGERLDAVGGDAALGGRHGDALGSRDRDALAHGALEADQDCVERRGRKLQLLP